MICVSQDSLLSSNITSLSHSLEIPVGFRDFFDKNSEEWAESDSSIPVYTIDALNEKG